jgi:hypothetical protein
LVLSFSEQLARFYHKESSSPHTAKVPIEGAVLFELLQERRTQICGREVHNLKLQLFINGHGTLQGLNYYILPMQGWMGAPGAEDLYRLLPAIQSISYIYE